MCRRDVDKISSSPPEVACSCRYIDKASSAALGAGSAPPQMCGRAGGLSSRHRQDDRDNDDNDSDDPLPTLPCLSPFSPPLPFPPSRPSRLPSFLPCSFSSPLLPPLLPQSVGKGCLLVSALGCADGLGTSDACARTLVQVGPGALAPILGLVLAPLGAPVGDDFGRAFQFEGGRECVRACVSGRVRDWVTE